MITVTTPEELLALAGVPLGTSGWQQIPQTRIDAFAEVTGDNAAIHVGRTRPGDSEASADTIAHGLLTLSLGPACTYELIDFPAPIQWINYGFDKVRWLAPVPRDGRVRMHLAVEEVRERAGMHLVTFEQTFELEDTARPACIAHSVQGVTFPPRS